MKKVFFFFFAMVSIAASAQVGIGVATTDINPSAQLEVTSTTKGFMPPRMTYAQRNAIATPVVGLIVYCTDCATNGEMHYYNGTNWVSMAMGIAATLSIPSISTTAASSITGALATSGGTVSSDGGSTITARGVCWSTTANPTIADSITTDVGTTGAFTSSITGLTQQTIYYVRAYATNSMGTAYGSPITFTTGALSVGNSYLGGVVAYFLVGGDAGYSTTVKHGFIAATSDQGTGNTWNNGTNTSTNASPSAIGWGLPNTNTIIASQGNTGTYAAKICRDYTGGGYTDWYLPTSGELAKLYLNRVAIGGFAAANYWSSTEHNATNVCKYYFFNGSNNCSTAKTQLYYVRAIRSF